MKKYVLVCIVIGLFIASSLRATDDWTYATMPFKTGVNFTNWLDDLWAGYPPNNRRWFDNFHESDFANAKSLGVDFVRLPIAPFTNAGDKPDGTIDAYYLQKVDSAVTWAERYGLYIILDNHEFDGNHPTSTATEPLLLNAWKQLATRYKDRSELILYEVLNEPFNIDATLWGQIQGRVVDLIRTIDETHYIIVGGADWNSMWNMGNLPIYPHNRLIYNFHFYEPSLLTEPGLGDQANVKNLPFPYDPVRMPSPPPGAVAWVVAAYAAYKTQGTEAYLASCLDPAATFAKQHNVPVMCTEYGCNGDNNIQQDRVRYFEAVVKLFNERNIPHASWGYKYGGFGITTVDGGDAFPGFMYHINIDICRAMGLTPPAEVTTIKSVTVSPATCSVQRGKTQQFNANGTTTSGGSTSSVIWTVNSANGSAISEAGVLSVSRGETESALTVTATSVWDTDGSKAATATVTLTGMVNAPKFYVYKTDKTINVYDSSDVDSISFTVPRVPADMTSLLKNTQTPFTKGGLVAYAGNPNRFYYLADWLINDACQATGNLDYHDYFGGGGAMGFEAIDGVSTVENGKLYQTIELEAGYYRFDAYFQEYQANPRAYVVANIGNDLPDIDDVETTATAYTPVTFTGETTFSIKFALTKKSTVSLGFVGSCNWGARVMFSKVELWQE